MRNPFWRVYEDQEMRKIMPWWMGCSYWRMDRCDSVFILLPFNKVFAWARDFWFWLHQPSRGIEDQKAWDRGFKQGTRYGREQFVNEISSCREYGQTFKALIFAVNRKRKERGEAKL